MSATSIQWCDHSINPIRARHRETGAIGHYCEKIAPGCAHCYASDLQKRFKMPAFVARGRRLDDVEPFLDETKLAEVRRRKKPTRYFWCDMSDLFGHWVRAEWLDACFKTMDETPQHTHLVLTKRPEMVDCLWPTGESRRNVWLGCSVSDQKTADESIPALLECRPLSPVLYLSIEPLLGPVDVSRYLETGINWVIVGGESGQKARKCDMRWIADIIDQCAAAGVPCFVKQLGAVVFHDGRFRDWGAKRPEDPVPGGWLRFLKDAKGGDMAEWPESFRVREFPGAAR